MTNYYDCAEVIRFKELKASVIPDRFFKINGMNEIDVNNNSFTYKLKIKLMLLTARIGFLR